MLESCMITKLYQTNSGYNAAGLEDLNKADTWAENFHKPGVQRDRDSSTCSIDTFVSQFFTGDHNNNCEENNKKLRKASTIRSGWKFLTETVRKKKSEKAKETHLIEKWYSDGSSLSSESVKMN